jgi:parallel beta-helix repeat protein
VRKRIFFETLLMLLLITMINSTFHIEIVNADSSTIYIRADGSVDPSTAPIQHTGNVYTFTANINDHLIVERDNTILDGNNYKLQGAGTGYGVFLDSRNNVTIKNVYVTGFQYGIYLKLSTDCDIDGNGLANNALGGVWVGESNGNNVTNNAVVNNYAGVLLTWSNNTNIIANNSLRNNQAGIWLIVSSNDIIKDNTIAGSKIGGIYLDRSNNNLIYHNNLLSNTPQAVVPDSTSTWDNGYPSGGNYWSDYTGTDDNSDGIGDTAYTIDENNTDRYPLMNMQGTHDVAVTNIAISKTVIGQGYTTNITVTLQNKGSLTQIFNVTVPANSTIIQTQPVYIRSGQFTTLKIVWNTTGWTKSAYEIYALADRVSGETDPNAADNLLIFGMIKITVPGDVDGDRDIDIYDIVTIASIYGSKLGESSFKLNADIDSDNRISIYDVVIAASRYGYSE